MPKLKYLSSLNKKAEDGPPTVKPAPGHDVAEALEDPAVREQYAKRLQADAYRNDLAAYIRAMWHVIEPNTELTWNWHHQLMCRVLQGMWIDWERVNDNPKYKQKCRNVIFNVPPGSLKSRIISVGFQTWVWTRRPGVRFICLSVNEDASLRDARDSRTVLRSDWYQNTFEPDWSIKEDQDAISNFGNSSGGVRLSRAQGAEIVGLRGDCLAGESLVATEWGDISIEKLHELYQSGNTVPRVWSQNESGGLELKAIQATRRIDSRPICEVRTESDNVLRCTDDHKIYSEGDYTQAAHLSGRRVSIMRKSDVPVQKWNTATVQGLSVREPYLCTVPDGIPTTRSGVRQARAARAGSGALLLEVVQDDAQSACDYQAMPEMRTGIPTTIDQDDQEILLDSMPRQLSCRNEAGSYTGKQGMSSMWSELSPNQLPYGLLYKGLCEQITQYSHEGFGEFQLLGKSKEALPGRSLGEPCATDSPEGQVAMCGVPFAGNGLSAVNSTSYRPQPEKQYTGESDHSLRYLSHEAPQVESSAVISVDKPTIDNRRVQVPVYDIQVEGNHNFFANGILVHNCILNDDPNNPKEAESKTVRDEVNELWTTNIHNRVNHPTRSLRIGVQQRTHALDWTGYVTANDGVWTPQDPDPDKWLVVAIPAEFEPERRCVTPWGKDPRKVAGQTIDEERAPKSFLIKERARFGSAKYAGQMQQRPALSGGGRVKTTWWNWFTLGGISDRTDGPVDNARNATMHYPYPQICAPGDAPRPKGTNDSRAKEVGRDKYYQRWDFDWVMITVDPAVKKTVRGSNFGILVVGAQGMRRFILEDATQKGDIIEIVKLLKELTARWRPDKIIIEEKAAGHDVMLMLREEIADGKVRDHAGNPVTTIIEPINPGTADKEMRLDACIPQIEAGLVFLLEGSDWKEFVEEFAMFPNGRNDDRVDALSQLLNYMKSEGGYDLPSW